MKKMLSIGIGLLFGGFMLMSVSAYADDIDSSEQVNDFQQSTGVVEDPEEAKQQQDSEDDESDFDTEVNKDSGTTTQPVKPIKVRQNGYPKGQYQIPKFMQGYWKGFGKPHSRYAGYKFYSNWWKSFDTDIYNSGGKWYGQRQYSSPYKIYKKPHKNRYGWWVISSVLYIKAKPDDPDPYWSYNSNSDKDVFYIKYVSKRHIKITFDAIAYQKPSRNDYQIFDLKKLK